MRITRFEASNTERLSGTRKRSAQRMLWMAICGVLGVVALLSAGCRDNSGSGGPTHPYVCENGTAAAGGAAAENTQKCGACNATYRLVSDICVPTVFQFVCENGTPHPGHANAENTQNCISCNEGYRLNVSNNTCVSN